ncbi:M81 family metallopeptidase [Gymnodinialimonas sp. 2305UL16-5]|uniref:M81 family metallopeptidase n=1 Tax=Gymnodinialimonas mytili TaxID=3126503 RepID=UPI0030A61F5B
MTKRVAIGGLHTECSSMNPLFQQASDFKRIVGEDLLAQIPFDFDAEGLTPLPLFQDRSVPGGPVAPETYAAQRDALLTAIKDAMPLDAVLLLMHGAMFVPGIGDPEGELINDIRDIIGPEAMLAGSFDLHGQITAHLTDALDIFAAYRTAPHVDVAETHRRAAAMLARALQGGPRPSVYRRAVPLLMSGEMSSTFVEPCASLYAALPEHDARPGIWDANLMIGYVWADIPRATAAAVVTATDAAAGQAAADDIAQSYWDARHDLTFDMDSLPLDEALAALPDGGILADSGDNPTGGGVGDRADVLEALLRSNVEGAALVGIADPAAFSALQAGGRQIDTGGSLGGGGPCVRLQIEGVRFAMDCAVAQVGGVTVVISEKRRPFHNLEDFDGLGLDLDAIRLLVVKSGYLSPDLRALPRRQIMALTDGAVNQDIAALPNHHRPRPTWPMQRDFDWSAYE